MVKELVVLYNSPLDGKKSRITRLNYDRLARKRQPNQVVDKKFENDQMPPTMLRYVTLKFCMSRNTTRIRLLMNSYLYIFKLHMARWKSIFCMNLIPCENEAYGDEYDDE